MSKILFRCDLEFITITEVSEFIQMPPVGKWLYGSDYDLIKDHSPYAYFYSRVAAEEALTQYVENEIQSLKVKLGKALGVYEK